MEIYDWNDYIFTCCQGGISIWILRTVLYPPAEVDSGQAPSRDLPTQS